MSVETAAPNWSLNLLGYWQLRSRGMPIDVGVRQQRLITIVALLGSRPRGFIASRLWPDSSESHAAGSLRASLFKISHELPELLRSSADTVELETHVAVDIEAVRRMIDELATIGRVTTADDPTEVLSAAELLPGWYEDWVLFEQERLNQQRLTALELLARRLLDRGEYDHAVDAARAAAAIEPLRESTHLLLLEGHLASGNRAVASAVHAEFRHRLLSELGIAPSPRFAELLNGGAPVPASTRDRNRFPGGHADWEH